MFPAGLTSGRKSSNPSASSGLGLFAQTPQTKGRGSFNPGSAMSSVGRPSLGGVSNRTAQEDRPINDPGYHRHCVQKLNDFLVNNLGQSALPAKFVSAPSSHDIRKVFEVLMNFIGIPLSKTPAWDQEIAGIMRTLGYRYPIAKKNLAVSTTSMHAKGQLFGLFSWLVDALGYATKTSTEKVIFGERDEEGMVSATMFLKFVFNDEEKEAGMTELYGKMFGTEGDFKALRNNEKKLQQEVNDVDLEIKDYNETEAIVKNLIQEVSKQDKFVSEMEECISKHRETATTEVKEIESRIKRLTKEIQEHERQRQSLIQLLNEQEFGQDDLKWSLERQQQIKQEIDSETKAIEELKKIVRTVRLEGKQHEDKLLKMQSDIHTCLVSVKEAVFNPRLEAYVSRLKKCFSSPLFAEVCDFLLKRSTVLSGEESRDSRCKLNVLIEDLKMEIVQQSVALEGHVMNEQTNILTEIEAIIAENERKIQLLNQEIDDYKRQFTEQSALYEHEYAKASKEYEMNRKYLIELEDKLGKSESEMKAKIERLQDIVDKQRQELQVFSAKEVSSFKTLVEKEKQSVKSIPIVYENKLREMQSLNEDFKKEIKRESEKEKKLGDQLAAHEEKKRKRGESKENRNA